MAEQITWDDDIKGYFTQLDIGHMRSAPSWAQIDLANYDEVKENAQRIYEAVDAGRMPKESRKWPQGKIDNFKAWWDDNCPKSKTETVV